MTIILKPSTEAMLLEKARRDGQDPDAIVNNVLSDFLEVDSRDPQEAATVVREAIQAERGKPIEQYIAEQRVKHGHSESWPPRGIVEEVAPGVFVDKG